MVVHFLWRSRGAKAEKCRRLKGELDEARRLLAARDGERRQSDARIQELQQANRRLEAELQKIQAEPVRLPPDPPLPESRYGVRMICLTITLARAVGFRGAHRVLKIVFEWLGVEQRVPDFTTIRRWSQRVGVAILTQPVEKADDWIWLADHSNQIGPEKVLVVLGIRAASLPKPGQSLRHEDVHPLVVQPGVEWKKEHVAQVYEELARRHGPPRSLLTDGAAELREAGQSLRKLRPDILLLQDFKHKAANLFKAMLHKDPRFLEFNAQLGRTRCAIQQTELAHLNPPSLKQKARFMNLARQLNWAYMILTLLKHPEAKSRQWMTPERLEDKLGWLRSFVGDVAAWHECQQVINRGLEQMNGYGLFAGAAKQLRAAIGNLQHSLSRQLAEPLIDFVTQAEKQLNPGERLPMSTEILESAFGLYKQLERQHSQSGFTGLLACFPILLRNPIPDQIREAFRRVSTKDVNQWVAHNLTKTVTAKRLATYREMKKLTNDATISLECT
jgi:hypothetical protein